MASHLINPKLELKMLPMIYSPLQAMMLLFDPSMLSAGSPAICAASLLEFIVGYLMGYPILAGVVLAQLTGY
jgi:hypothetical protein